MHMVDEMKHKEGSRSVLPFSNGMRVLVVDDDKTCLKLMYNLLRKCQYHVSTSKNAKEALKLLKRRQIHHDIMICDVEMQDIDGVKILQLLGIEMNIPIIMLTSDSKRKRVMQTTINGGCDYLLLVKPVGIEEIQNIWHDVFMGNKWIPVTRLPPPSFVKQAPSSSNNNNNNNNNDVSQTLLQDEAANNDGDEDKEDSGCENEETTLNPKKTRLFWTVELHQKFVDAVKTLGIERAFPKKILEIMNVEGLTREKVASHLQKYRIYLRRVNTAASSKVARNASSYANNDGNGPVGGEYGVFSSLSREIAGEFPGTNSSSLLLQQSMFHPMASNFISSSFPPTMSKFQFATPSPNLYATPMFQGFSSLNQNKANLLYGNQSQLTSPSFIMSSPYNEVSGCGSNLLHPYSCLSNCDDTSIHSSSVLPHDFQHNLFTTSNVSGNYFQNVENNNPTNYVGEYSFLENFQVQGEDGRLDDSSNGMNNFNYLGQSKMTWQDNNNNPSDTRDSYNNLYDVPSPLIQNVVSGHVNNNDMSVLPFTYLEGGETSPPLLRQNSVEVSNIEKDMELEDFLVDDQKLITSSSNNDGQEYLEDIVGRFLKQGNEEKPQAKDEFDPDSFILH